MPHLLLLLLLLLLLSCHIQAFVEGGVAGAAAKGSLLGKLSGCWGDVALQAAGSFFLEKAYAWAVSHAIFYLFLNSGSMCRASILFEYHLAAGSVFMQIACAWAVRHQD
jgi:hypothetical protein